LVIANVSVGGKVTAAGQNSVIDDLNLLGKHAEFTAVSASVATSTSSSVGGGTALAIDGARSNDSLFVTASAATTLTITNAGLYSIDVTGSIPVAPTGLFYVQATDGTNLGRTLGVTASGVIGGSLFASYYFTAGTVLTWSWLHTSAANRVLTLRIAVTEIGAY